MRPTLWRIARELGLTGSVRNDGAGVVLDVWAPAADIEQSLLLLQQRLPPLARIDAIQRQPLADRPAGRGFEIIASSEGAVETAVVADAATCPACLDEISNPRDRRHRYAFTNCTHCGPRFSILKALPFDRATTSMAPFAMCPGCRAEYHNPADRRFHAQPNACPACGPGLWLQDGGGRRIDCDDAIEQAARLITAGQIVAIKGIGGFHLACDAANEESVRRLRQRKRRYHKPLALLARDGDMVRRHARVDELEARLLASAAAPIVLLRPAGQSLAASLAPGHRRLGFALPSTPLHHLLMRCLEGPIVFTSGNVSDEPQCTDNDDALKKLAPVADAFLLHNREIVNRVDDSVVRVSAGTVTTLRRARGHAPAAFTLPAGFDRCPRALAMGAEAKNTFCLSFAAQAVVSQYIGDLASAPVLADYRRQLQRYQSLYHHRPELIVVDKHPDYRSAQCGRELARARNIDCVEVQHHHAHIAAVMAEHRLPLEDKPVLGIALDGLGMGDDGSLWGGEFMRADYRQCRRLASFEALPLPGGDRAMREPWRNTLAQLLHYFDWEALSHEFPQLELIDYLQSKPVATIGKMIAGGINTPLCSSAGRLFDAVAAAIGVCRDELGYEGQAAMELEALADEAGPGHVPYPVEWRWRDGLRRLSWAPMWRALLNDLQQRVPKGEIAAAFHAALVRAVADLAVRLCREQGLGTVVLAGGVFQNALLLEGVTGRLSQHGLEVVSPRCLPAGDGAISLGQVAVACARHQGVPGRRDHTKTTVPSTQSGFPIQPGPAGVRNTGASAGDGRMGRRQGEQSHEQQQ